MCTWISTPLSTKSLCLAKIAIFPYSKRWLKKLTTSALKTMLNWRPSWFLEISSSTVFQPTTHLSQIITGHRWSKHSKPLCRSWVMNSQAHLSYQASVTTTVITTTRPLTPSMQKIIMGSFNKYFLSKYLQTKPSTRTQQFKPLGCKVDTTVTSSLMTWWWLCSMVCIPSPRTRSKTWTVQTWWWHGSRTH